MKLVKTEDGFEAGVLLITRGNGLRDPDGHPLWEVQVYGDQRVGHGHLVLTEEVLVMLWRMIPRVVEVPVPRQVIELHVAAAASRPRRRRKADPEREQHEAIKRGLRGRNTP